MTSILGRISQILQSNIHDLLDKAEDPEKMLAQTLREWGAAYQQLHDQTSEVLVQQKVLESQSRDAHRQAGEWERKAKTALKAGDDDAARECLQRKKNLLATVGKYDEKTEELGDIVSTLQRERKSLERKRQEAEREGALIIARWHASKAQQRVDEVLTKGTTYDPRGALDRANRKATIAEARAGAKRQLRESSLERRVEILEEYDPDIENEMEALKDQLFPRQLPPGNR